MRFIASFNLKPSLLLGAAILFACSVALAQGPTYRIGRAPTADEVKAWDHAVGPDGKELPPGSGTGVDGAKIFGQKCSFCHGKNGQGIFPTPKLTGGVGTLNSYKPIRTSVSYLPYATTIWDFINRAMPRDAEWTLSSDEVYSLTAFILSRDGVIKETDVLDKKTLPEVIMPNRYGFFPDPPQAHPSSNGWLPYWNSAPGWKDGKQVSK